MAPKLIVIMGITGNQGASVAEAFLNDPGWKVRGITRDPKKASSKVWSDKGAEMVAGEADDVESLKAAFSGAKVIYGFTDFWTVANNPANYEIAEKEGKAINQLCYETEIRQGGNVVDAAAATVDTLDLFVWSVLSHATARSNGTITGNLHFDAKQGAVQRLEKYPELKSKTSFMMVGLFLTNWKSNEFMQPKKKADGTYVLRLPTKAETVNPFVNPRWDIGACVKALTQIPPGKTLLGVAQWATWKDFADEWANANGVTCTYEVGPYEEADAAIPGGIGHEIGEMFRYFDNFGYTGGDTTVIEPKDVGIEKVMTPISEYMRREDWSTVLNAKAA